MKIRVDVMTHDRHRDQIMAWCRANGLDPAMIPLGREMTIEDSKLTVPYYVLDVDGRKVVNESRTAVETYDMTVPLVEDWPL